MQLERRGHRHSSAPGRDRRRPAAAARSSRRRALTMGAAETGPRPTMCGICGSTFDPDQSSVRAMCTALRHRGPDDHGVHLGSEGEVTLGVRRLSVIDPADGHQPRANEDGTVWAAFNGEIYNHPELRDGSRRAATSSAAAPTPRCSPISTRTTGTTSSTSLEGMFALAIWDAEAERLLLARDRFGEKPLFYSRHGRDAPLRLRADRAGGRPRQRPGRRPRRPRRLLRARLRAAPRGSILEGVNQVPPGHTMVWDRRSGRAELRPLLDPAGAGDEARRSRRANWPPRPAGCSNARSAAGSSPTSRSASSSAAGSTRR